MLAAPHLLLLLDALPASRSRDRVLYLEVRPAYTGEATYEFDATIPGTSSLASWTLVGELYDPNGVAIADAVTAVVSSISERIVTVTVEGQTVAGDYRYVVRRDDDASGFVVVWGVVQVSDPAGDY